jgi:Domain of unknown function (DUF397)
MSSGAGGHESGAGAGPLSTEWRKASRCANSGCVEAQLVGDEINLRNSKQPGGATVTCSREEWRTFVAAVKDGEFDPD